MQLDPTALTPAVNRIKRARGQLDRVLRMFEEGRDCGGRRHPAPAASRALDRAGFAIVATVLRECVTEGDGLDGVDAKKMEKLSLSLA